MLFCFFFFLKPTRNTALSEMCLLVSAGIKTKINFSVAFNPNSLDYRDIDKLQDVNISISKSISMIVKLWMTDNDKYNVHRFSRETAKCLQTDFV